MLNAVSNEKIKKYVRYTTENEDKFFSYMPNSLKSYQKVGPRWGDQGYPGWSNSNRANKFLMCTFWIIAIILSLNWMLLI